MGLAKDGALTGLVANTGLIGVPGAGVLVRHGMTAVDHSTLRDAFRISARLLFAAGAEQVTPPVSTAPSLHSPAEAESFCRRVRPGDWEPVSVHGMASARMGRPERGGVCDAYGRPYGFEGLRVCDASVLSTGRHGTCETRRVSLAVAAGQSSP